MHTKPTTYARALGLGALLLLAACSSDPGPRPQPAAPAPTVATESPTTTEAPAPVAVQAEAPEDTTPPTTTPPATGVTLPEPVAPPVTRRTTTTVAAVLAPAPARQAPSAGGLACGGALPPCWVMRAESTSPDYPTGGDPTIANSGGSGASWKWQFMPSTWDGYGGYATAADAPVAVQDAAAAELWNGGRGCSHWDAC